MNKRKGLTLVEVIVSIGLLSMLLGFFSAALVNQYKMMIATKKITKYHFAASKSLEREIIEVRNILGNGDIPAQGTLKSYTLFTGANKVTVQAYEIYTTVTDPPVIGGSAGEKFFTVVSDRKIIEVPAPSITELKIELSTAAGVVSTCYGNEAGAKITSTHKLYVPPGVTYKMNTYKWYISRPGLLSLPQDLSDEENAKFYPIFPDDYQIIPGQTGTSLNIKPEYAGRYLVLGATPAAVNGKLGDLVVSAPVFIMGLPNTHMLMTHFDASMTYLEAEARKVELGGGLHTYFQKSLRNLANPAQAVMQHDVAAQPELMPEQFGQFKLTSEGVKFYDIWGRKLCFRGGQAMETSFSYSNMKEMTVFVVAKTADKEKSTVLTIDGGANKLALDFNGMHNSTEDLIEIGGPDKDKWQLLGFAYGPEGGKSSLTYFYNKSDMDLPSATVNANLPSAISGQMVLGVSPKLGESEVEVAEIIVYKSKLDAAGVDVIRNYLYQKYGIG